MYFAGSVTAVRNGRLTSRKKSGAPTSSLDVLMRTVPTERTLSAAVRLMPRTVTFACDSSARCVTACHCCGVSFHSLSCVNSLSGSLPSANSTATTQVLALGLLSCQRKTGSAISGGKTAPSNGYMMSTAARLCCTVVTYAVQTASPDTGCAGVLVCLARTHSPIDSITTIAPHAKTTRLGVRIWVCFMSKLYLGLILGVQSSATTVARQPTLPIFSFPWLSYTAPCVRRVI